MEEKIKNKNESNNIFRPHNDNYIKYIKHIYNFKTKSIIFVILAVISSNIRFSNDHLINNKKDNFNPLTKVNKNRKQNKKIISQELIDTTHWILKKELDNKYLEEINNKRTFEKRYPLPKEIKCSEHLKDAGLIDMMAFTSFLTKNTIFFEFASGCSSIIAKYYAKKSYAVEGNKKWYDIGISNGLKQNLLFKDLKCDGSGPMLSWPGKKSNINDWKKFIQAYKKEYNADVIFIDGRFRVACALDIFGKIKNDTVVLLHECQRKQYSLVNNYYDKIYTWKSLCLLQKKKNVKEVPLDLQEKYWHIKY